MVVVDASALIPLARVGELRLLDDSFIRLATTDGVKAEVLEDGQPGAAALARFFDRIDVCDAPARTAEVARRDGLASGDAAILLLADEHDDILLANDSALLTVARTYTIECWWVPTLLLHAAEDGILSGETAAELLYDLVDVGMHLHPHVYAKVEHRLRARG